MLEEYNMNTTNTSQLSTYLLDGFIPGFSLIRDAILQNLGFDIGALVTGLAMIVGLGKLLGIARSWFDDHVLTRFTTTVIIPDGDDLFDDFRLWCSECEDAQNVRITQAVTPTQDLLRNYDFTNSSNHSHLHWAPDTKQQLFDFEAVQASAKVRNTLHYTSFRLVRNGTILWISRDRRLVMARFSGSACETERSVFRVKCLGRSRAPIMSIVEEARRYAAAKERGYTKINRPEQGYLGERHWTRAAVRYSRPMQSVIMDHKQKVDVVQDVNSFIWPETARWYGSRGIPHRRGYLFSGAPGTGKTSLAFALSGVFNLRLQVISLMDKEITDASLLALFCKLPDRCIVLFEDVDAAGLKRRDGDGSDENDAMKEYHRKTKITLSGLLNVLDGVATQEGRIVIMTSNYPEKLDSALVRPGRIDKHIRFGLASRQQLADLFLAMYTSDTASPNSAHTVAEACREIACTVTRTSDVPGYSTKEFKLMSEEFADKVPEHRFSPAAVQGYLLLEQYRCDPRAALDELEAWVVENQGP